MTQRTSCHIQKHSNHPCTPNDCPYWAKGTGFHSLQRKCTVLPPLVDLFKQDQPCLGCSVFPIGTSGIGYRALGIISCHVRLGEKNYAMDSRSLNGYPCLHLCLHTSHPCENTSEELEVGGWWWKRAPVCLTVPALNQVNGFYSLHH